MKEIDPDDMATKKQSFTNSDTSDQIHININKGLSTYNKNNN